MYLRKLSNWYMNSKGSLFLSSPNYGKVLKFILSSHCGSGLIGLKEWSDWRISLSTISEYSTVKYSKCKCKGRCLHQKFLC